ncbi:MAG TPA: replication protein [Pyrinomonadaceae bacterium]|jgi:DNA-binding Lrp family transcriptional regulator|nr:replication protein [Pyrinomonadaceae bacterium]
MTSKKRKYGDLSARPLPTNDPSLLDDVFAAFMGARPAPAEAVPEADEAATDDDAQTAEGIREASGAPAQYAGGTPAQKGGGPLHGAAAAQYAGAARRAGGHGYTRVSNELFDRILPTLDTYDQAVLLRLYRLSRGFASDTCRVSVPVLASACNISERQVRKSIDKLEGRELVKRVEQDCVNKDLSMRGLIFRVLISDPTPAQRAAPAQYAPAAQRAAPAQCAANKERKAFKENIKRKVRRLTPAEVESFAARVADLVAGGKTFEEAESQLAGGMHPMDWVTVKSVAIAQAQVRRRKPSATDADPSGETPTRLTEAGKEGK